MAAQLRGYLYSLLQFGLVQKSGTTH